MKPISEFHLLATATILQGEVGIGSTDVKLPDGTVIETACLVITWDSEDDPDAMNVMPIAILMDEEQKLFDYLEAPPGGVPVTRTDDEEQADSYLDRLLREQMERADIDMDDDDGVRLDEFLSDEEE